MIRLPCKLADLHPECGVVTDYGPDAQWFLSFDCPTTPGGRVMCHFHRAPQKIGVWEATSRFKVTPGLEHLGETPDLTCLTLRPSIGDHHCHKRGRCSGHVHITNGMVTP